MAGTSAVSDIRDVVAALDTHSLNKVASETVVPTPLTSIQSCRAPMIVDTLANTFAYAANQALLNVKLRYLQAHGRHPVSNSASEIPDDLAVLVLLVATSLAYGAPDLGHSLPRTVSDSDLVRVPYRIGQALADQGDAFACDIARVLSEFVTADGPQLTLLREEHFAVLERWMTVLDYAKITRVY